MAKKQEYVTFDQLREVFPKPSSYNRLRGKYCVGGALCMTVYGGHTIQYRFPSENVLSDAIQYVSGRVTKACVMAATRIIALNESEKFIRAWLELKDALRGRKIYIGKRCSS